MFVFDKEWAGSGTTSTLLPVPAGGVAAGNLVLVMTVNRNGLPTSVTDAKGNTYSLVGSTTTVDCTMYMSVLTTALAAGDNITVAHASGFTAAKAVSFSGNAASPLDVWVIASNSFGGNTSGLNPGGNLGALAADNELIVAFAACDTFATATGWASTPGNGFTGLAESANGTNEALDSWYRILGSGTAGTTPSPATASGVWSANRTYSGIAAAFKAAGGASGPTYTASPSGGFCVCGNAVVTFTPGDPGTPPAPPNNGRPVGRGLRAPNLRLSL